MNGATTIPFSDFHSLWRCFVFQLHFINNHLEGSTGGKDKEEDKKGKEDHWFDVNHLMMENYFFKKKAQHAHQHKYAHHVQHIIHYFLFIHQLRDKYPGIQVKKTTRVKSVK